MFSHPWLRISRSSSRVPRSAPPRPGVLLCAIFIVLTGCGSANRLPTNEPATRVVQPPAPRSAMAPLRCTVDVYADSIMSNNGTQERPIASLQKQYPALTFIDHSAPEVLLTDLARRFDDLPRSGRWVVIQSGVIDAWRNVKPALYVQALQDIIDGLRAEGREPILTGFSRQVEMPELHIRKPQLIRRARYDELTRLVALDRKVPFVDWGAVRFDGPDDLQDGIHPNRAYSDRLFEKLLATLERVTGCK
jgi:hypothetical protein